MNRENILKFNGCGQHFIIPASKITMARCYEKKDRGGCSRYFTEVELSGCTLVITHKQLEDMLSFNVYIHDRMLNGGENFSSEEKLFDFHSVEVF